jgi:hypothetical protein
MKKPVLLYLLLIFTSFVFAQQETLDEWTFCSGYKIMNYLESENIHSKVFENPDRPNADQAVSAAWNAFNFAFSLESLPVGAINEIFEPSALGKINDVMGNVGNSLALIQIASDYSKGDKLSATSNATKTGMFYIIGKWGWKSLKLAGVGLQVFDYMLTSFGQYAVSARQDALAEAYNKYYNSGMGKRDLTQWKEIFNKLDSQEAVQKEIDNYLDKYFQADALDKEISGGLYTDKEVAAVKKDYLNTYLLPYLQPLFLKLEEEARDEQMRRICDDYRKVIRQLNTKSTYRIHVKGTPDQLALCKVGIEVMNDGNKSLYVKSSLNSNDFADLSFTKYSLLKNNVSMARAVLRYESPDGTKQFYENIDLKNDQGDIYFKLPEEKEEDLEQQEEQIVEQNKPAEPEKKANQAPAAEPLELTPTISAVFAANGTPLNIKIKKTKETAAMYYATVVHKQFPKGNTLTINKTTRELTFIYKLKGLFAPELICKGLPVAPNTYSGTIVTNDGNNVSVGVFSMILQGK